MRSTSARVPRHIGVIPDGNRRWAERRSRPRSDGYAGGIGPGLDLYKACRAAGIEEISVYGFTKDNVRRPAAQVAAFKTACVGLAGRLRAERAPLRVVGDRESVSFPDELREPAFSRGAGPIVNLLVNYGWEWDVQGLKTGAHRTAEIPPLDLIIRWGGGRRLSGFLPIQAVYADIYVVDNLWPDYRDADFTEALRWFARQDRTRGG